MGAVPTCEGLMSEEHETKLLLITGSANLRWLFS